MSGRIFTNGLPSPEAKRVEFARPLTDALTPGEDIPIIEEPAPLPAKAAFKTFVGIKILGAVVAGTSAVVSGYNCYEWFASIRPAPIAVLMSFAITASSIVLPDFAVMLFQRKRMFIILGVVIALIGVVATGFCMTTTVAALYNGRTKTVEAHDDASSKVSGVGAQITLLESQKSHDEEALSGFDSGIRSSQRALDTLGAEGATSPQGQLLQARINQARTAKKSYEADLARTIAALSALHIDAGAVVARRDDFFVFLAKVLKSDSDATELYISAAPAVFLDVVAPVMAGVALFL